MSDVQYAQPCREAVYGQLCAGVKCENAWQGKGVECDSVQAAKPWPSWSMLTVCRIASPVQRCRVLVTCSMPSHVQGWCMTSCVQAWSVRMPSKVQELSVTVFRQLRLVHWLFTKKNSEKNIFVKSQSSKLSRVKVTALAL